MNRTLIIGGTGTSAAKFSLTCLLWECKPEC